MKIFWSIFSLFFSDVVLKTKVLVSRTKNSLGLETQSLGLGLGVEILALVLVLTKSLDNFQDWWFNLGL